VGCVGWVSGVGVVGVWVGQAPKHIPVKPNTGQPNVTKPGQARRGRAGPSRARACARMPGWFGRAGQGRARFSFYIGLYIHIYI